MGACLGLSVLQRSSDLTASLLYKLHGGEAISEKESKLVTALMEEVSRCLPEDVRKEQEMSKPSNWHENDILMFSGRMISANKRANDKEATEQLFKIVKSIFKGDLFAIFDQMYGKESPFSWDDLKSDFLGSKKVFGMSYNAASRKEGRLEMLEYCAQCSYRQFAFTTEMSQDEIWTMMELEFGKQNKYLSKLKESSRLTEKMVFYAGHIPLYWIEIFEEYVVREGKDLDKAANAFWEVISPSDHFKGEYKRLNELSSTRGKNYMRNLSEIVLRNYTWHYYSFAVVSLTLLITVFILGVVYASSVLTKNKLMPRIVDWKFILLTVMVVSLLNPAFSYIMIAIHNEIWSPRDNYPGKQVDFRFLLFDFSQEKVASPRFARGYIRDMAYQVCG